MLLTLSFKLKKINIIVATALPTRKAGFGALFFFPVFFFFLFSFHNNHNRVKKSFEQIKLEKMLQALSAFRKKKNKVLCVNCSTAQKGVWREEGA